MKVLFRVDRKSREVVAVFPTERNRGDIMCYAHVGQHSDCCREWVTQDTRNATPNEYAPLLAELRTIGYDDLQIIKRMPRTA